MTTTIAGSLQAAGCSARWSAEELTVENARLTRRWRIENGLLYPVSLCAEGHEWLAQPSDAPAPTPACPIPDEPRAVEISAVFAPDGAVERPSLQVEMVARGATLTLTYRLRIFPDTAAVVMQLRAEQASTCEISAETVADGELATGIEVAVTQADNAQTRDLLERITVALPHHRVTQVSLYDRTDICNELTHTDEWLLHPSERNLRLSGNLFFVENTLTGAGLILLKHAPLPHARPTPSPCDLHVSRAVRYDFLGHEADPAEGSGYEWAVITYQGDATARTKALQDYQRQLRPYDAARDCRFLSNTWGDRSKDGRINAEFIHAEIEAAARLGVDVLQIDDGWQRGRTANSVEANGVWEGFWAANPHFWEVHEERFPEGLEPVVAHAKERGLRLGLWFAPDSAHDFANWQRDVDAILRLHTTYGVDYIKIDGVKARTKLGERNLRNFFMTLLRESAGRITFDQDVTAEIRPGYWGMVQVGPLFIENRYTDWRSYWPHHTLRNLWKLAQYVDPRRLRMEFLNNARHADKYPGDPLAPAAYTPDYLFATTMFANPLGWFETSNLPEEAIAAIAQLAAIWRAHRDALFSGFIQPIGAAPDGTAWTGFASIADNAGYLLLFRELNDQPEFTLPLPAFSDAYTCTRLAGEGEVTLHDGTLHATIPHAQRYLFVRVEQ